MEKELKFKKFFTSVMALSVAITSATNFSAFATEVKGTNTADHSPIKVSLKNSNPSYTVNIPSTVDLTETTGVSNPSYFYAKSSNQTIQISEMKNVTSVTVSMTDANPNNGTNAQIQNSDTTDKKQLTVTLDGTELKLDSSSSVTYETNTSKELLIKTEEYAEQISDDYIGTITFTTQANIAE